MKIFLQYILQKKLHLYTVGARKLVSSGSAGRPAAAVGKGAAPRAATVAPPGLPMLATGLRLVLELPCPLSCFLPPSDEP
jgi:hypothetical protein